MMGKRARRPQMKRTTSMTEFTLESDLSIGASNNPQQPSDPFTAGGGLLDGRLLAAAASSPRNNRRNSADFIETAQFLRSCSLCNRRLAPGRDVYMYRGDSAFCSLECRQQQINQDERRDKCSLVSKKEAAPAAAGGSAVVSTAGETVATV